MANFTDPDSGHDTIVAESTPRGAGAIAIVRLSGAGALQVLGALQPEGQRAAHVSHQLRRRRLVDGNGQTLDDAMVAWMQGPRSYTGEDVVELYLHGSPAVVEAVLAAAQRAGARQAAPGEFTRRAYLNGRLDLSQAEAVGALVGAQDAQQRQAALTLLEGQWGARLHPLLTALEGIVAAWRAALDFPDEVHEGEALPAALAAIAAAEDAIVTALAQARPLWVARPEVVLLGGVNVGKSTLLNALAAEERALVDATPGTTRDAIALEQVAGGVYYTVWDTAGLRSEARGLEARGVARTRERAHKASLRLWLTGAKGDVWPDPDLGRVAVVGSQHDCTDAAQRQRIEAEALRRGLPFVTWICAPSGVGLAALQAWLAQQVRPHQDDATPGLVVAARHRLLLERAAAALAAVRTAAATQQPLDFLLAEAEQAAAHLGQILGRDVDAAALDRIFADFCLGK